MDVLFLLIPFSVMVVFAVVVVFCWSLQDGQFDDLDSPARAVIEDDDRR